MTNQRTDKWGGTVESRLRFPTKLIEEIKSVIQKNTQKPFLLGFRLSPEESKQGGLRMKDTYELIERLVALDVDYIHASVSAAPI